MTRFNVKIDGQALKRQRKNRRITKKHIEKVVGLPRGMLSMIEPGICDLKITTINALCKHIGCKPEEIIFPKGSKL